MLNVPDAFVTAVEVVPFALFLTRTVAPGITPPPASTTVPEMDEVVLPCANADGLARQIRAAANISRHRLCLIYCSSEVCTRIAPASPDKPHRLRCRDGCSPVPYEANSDGVNEIGTNVFRLAVVYIRNGCICDGLSCPAPVTGGARHWRDECRNLRDQSRVFCP